MPGLPNLRDFGMMVDSGLLSLLGRLQRRYGHAFASEDGLRGMIHEDLGHMPGVGTVRAALVRLELQGIVSQRWLLPGQVLPSGKPCTYGTRMIYLPQGRANRRALAARAATRDRREGAVTRVNRAAVATLREAIAALGGQMARPVDTSQADFDRRRLASIDRAAELEARWAREEKPPDGEGREG